MDLEVWQDVLEASWGELDGEDKQACPTPQGLPISSDIHLSDPAKRGPLSSCNVHDPP